MNAYVVGQLTRCMAQFTNSAGSAIDPGAVYFRVRSPTGTLTEYTYGTHPQLVRTATGSYYADVDLQTSGRWLYRFEGSGNGQAAAEGEFLVEASKVL